MGGKDIYFMIRKLLEETGDPAQQLNRYPWERGVQWLSGRVLDSRAKGRGFDSHLRRCVVYLSKNINPSLVLVQPMKTHHLITERLLM